MGAKPVGSDPDDPQIDPCSALLWWVRCLLARALPPRALGGWMWLFVYAIMLAAVYSVQQFCACDFSRVHRRRLHDRHQGEL